MTDKEKATRAAERAQAQMQAVRQLLRAAYATCLSDDLSVEITISTPLMPTHLRYVVTSDQIPDAEDDVMIEPRHDLRS